MIFGDKLRELRLAKGWTQKHLGEKAGLLQSALTRWESGQQTPPFDAVQSICAALEVDCSAFNGCEFAAVENKRSRGRPPKAAEPEVKPVKARKKKGRSK